jgi:hypothetical protein
VPIRSPSTGISTAPLSAGPSTSQSTSNQRANGERGPSRSTDQSAAFCRTGVGIAMWFGTTSATADSPAPASAADSRSNAGSPPASVFNRLWSITS